jgi:hypothetical protein
VSLAILIKKKKYWILLLWFFLPFMYEILYAKLFTSRQALILTIPLFIAAGYGLSLLWEQKKIFGIILASGILVWSIYDIGILLTNPQQYPSLFADRAQVDASQYFYGFSSGYGVLEAVDYLEQNASTQPIIVLIRNDHGNPEDAVAAYLGTNPNVGLGIMNDPPSDVLKVFQKYGTSLPVYYVARGGYNAGLEKYFVSEKIFAKPNDKEFVGIATLKPAH